MRSTRGIARIIEIGAIGSGFVLVTLVASAAFGGRGDRPTKETTGSVHRISLPEFDASMMGCGAEAVVYAGALVDLEDAQAAADAAYEAWYTCVNGTPPPPPTPGGGGAHEKMMENTVSIVER